MLLYVRFMNGSESAAWFPTYISEIYKSELKTSTAIYVVMSTCIIVN